MTLVSCELERGKHDVAAPHWLNGTIEAWIMLTDGTRTIGFRRARFE